MVAPRKVTDQEKAEVERAVRASEEAAFPGVHLVITVGDYTNEDGKIPVNVVRTPRLDDSFELYPKGS